MKNELDTHLILDVYEIVHTHGEHNGDEYELEGIKVSTDHDGYTVYLSGHGVEMRLEFHNKYHLDYQTERQLDLFTRKLEQLRKTYHSNKG